jgi:hypothetical protein
MLRLLTLLPALVTQVFRSRRDLLLENLALRQQLTVLRRRHPPPRFSASDRFFWVILRRLYSGWKQALVGSCRRELFDHVIVLNERHLKRLMNEYVHYYHEDRTHLALAKGTPGGREVEQNTDAGCRVVSMPRLGGLHHRYDLAA